MGHAGLNEVQGLRGRVAKAEFMMSYRSLPQEKFGLPHRVVLTQFEATVIDVNFKITSIYHHTW